jgi:hypothetical protein
MQPIIRTGSNRIHQRLEEALQQGLEVRIKVADSGFIGVPIYLDDEFVELVYLYVKEDEDDQDEEPYARTVWLIRLAEIKAVAITQPWSRQRLNRLIKPDQPNFEITEGCQPQ